MKCPLNSALEFINYIRSPYIKDLDDLERLAAKFGWKTSYEIKKRARQNDTTVIITDLNQNIEWVSNCFEKLTDYERKDAIGKTPRILQGPLTDRKTLDKIKETILKNLPFKGELINYKKNGQLYLCNIEIYPLVNKQNHVVNYIAFEREG